MPWGPIKKHDGSGVPEEVKNRLTRMYFDGHHAAKRMIEEVVRPQAWTVFESRCNSWLWSGGFYPITRYQVFKSDQVEKLIREVEVKEEEPA